MENRVMHHGLVDIKQTKLLAAVIGLGQAGSRFDEELRSAIWSHTGAYIALSDKFDVVGGIDPNPNSRAKFSSRCPSAYVSSDVEDLKELHIDVISIATPYSVRFEVFQSILTRPNLPKVIVCEKPLASDSKVRRRIVEACAEKQVPLLVNYNRRYLRIYREFARILGSNDIGQLQSITLKVPNRIWSVGSHAIDLLFFLVGEYPESWRSLSLPSFYERGEPALDLICVFPSGVAGRMLTQASSRVLVFEVEAIGSKGRLISKDNGRILEMSLFKESQSYKGYVEIMPPSVVYEVDPKESSFVSLIDEAARVATGQAYGTSTGATAMATESFLDVVISGGDSHLG